MKLLQLMCIICSASVSLAQEQGITFQQNMSWDEIRNKARIERKYIMLDVFATWCGPCAEMSAKTFPSKAAGDYFNEHFISMKVQTDRTSKDDEFIRSWYVDAEKINDTYKITGYPTILYFDPMGEIIGRSVGFKDADGLIKDAESILANANEFNKMLDEFIAGRKDSAFLKKLAYSAKVMGREQIAHDVAEQFINGLNNQELFKEDNLAFAYQYTTSSKDRCFEIFKRQAKKVNAIFKSKTAAERKVRSIIISEEIEPYLKFNGKIIDWATIKKNVKKYGVFGLETYYGEQMMYQGVYKKNWEEFAKYYSLYYKTAYRRSKFNINNMSWIVFEHVENKKVLDVAIRTMAYNIKHFDAKEPASWDTYANLLYKAGRKKEAIEVQKKAVELEVSLSAVKGVQPNPALINTLKKMQAGESSRIIN